MTLRSQVYLLQLEDYDLMRFRLWQKNNPGREVVEKKGRIKWTVKAQALYFLGHIFGLETAVWILSPVDWLAKTVLVAAAKIKLLFWHRNLVTVGITGSWGKTTLKDQLAVMLAAKYHVYKTVGNNNTLLGVVLNVLRMPKEAEVFICEMGAYRPGDIAAICNLVKPRVGIITAVGPMHLERFGSLAAIKKTKYELLAAVPADGLKIEPGQDPVAAVAKYFGVPASNAAAASPHRLEVKETGGITIIDDAYNSNPEGFLRALAMLKRVPGRPKILVTPGMIELGKLQFAENKKAAAAATKVCDEIILIGETNREALVAGMGKKKYYLASDFAEAQKTMSALAKPGAVILLENDLPDQYF